MIVVVKIICVLMIIKGAVFLFFPSLLIKLVEECDVVLDNQKRMWGVFVVFVGSGIIFLSRIDMAVPLVHWLVVVAGLSMVLLGLILFVTPKGMYKSFLWFSREKNIMTATGMILITLGIIFYILT